MHFGFSRILIDKISPDERAWLYRYAWNINLYRRQLSDPAGMWCHVQITSVRKDTNFGQQNKINSYVPVQFVMLFLFFVTQTCSLSTIYFI